MIAASDFGWRSGCSTVEWLLAEPHRFDFHQAVRILRQTFPEQPLRFRSSNSLLCPANEISGLRAPAVLAIGKDLAPLCRLLRNRAAAYGWRVISADGPDDLSAKIATQELAPIVYAGSSLLTAEGIVLLQSSRSAHGVRVVILHQGEDIQSEHGFDRLSSSAVPAIEASMAATNRNRVPKVSISVSFLGLAGVNGPLPHPYSEMVLADKSGAAADFLDIFNHRLVDLAYESTRRHEPALADRLPQNEPVAEHLYSLMGLGIARLRSAQPNAAALTAYAGLLARPVRTAAGIESIVYDYFGIPVRVRQFTGVWRTIDSLQQTRIGRSGANQTLGGDAVIGTRVWDETGAITVVLGPLSIDAYMQFLPAVETRPASPARKTLEELLRFCLGNQYEAQIELKLRKPEAPPANFPKKTTPDQKAPVLGLTSFVVREPDSERDSEYVVQAGGV
jgi:type VI secretion system protein ImpH